MTAAPKQSEPGPAQHHVQIHIDNKGFRYAGKDGNDAASIVVRQGDHVSWQCDHGNYSILFKRDSPFGDIAFHGPGNKSVSAVVKAPSGKYQYGVTVALDSGLRVDDPEIIVDNSGN